MNVTSMLSSGYLQPYRDAAQPVKETVNAGSAMSAEASVLAQEKALKAASGPDAEVTTTYTYTTGPDGRRYITGAVVSIKSGDKASKSQTAGGEKVELSGSAGGAKENGKTASASKTSDPDVDAEVQKLEQIEREVVAHEAAHQAAGGALAGAVSYSYTKGPDGKSYITGGEVPISMPSSSGDPAETIRNMAQVQRAAMAPGSPSGQDMSVAAQAAGIAAAARQELAAKGRENGPDAPVGSESTSTEDSSGFSSGVASVKAGLLFERLHGEDTAKDGYALSLVEELPDDMSLNPAEAYGRNASDRGLWTLERGFETSQTTRKTQNAEALRPAFSVAA